MSNNALYFPYIDFPKNDWCLQTLLYWDKLSSITPYDHVFNPEKLTPFTRDLLSAELVEQVIPGHYIYFIPNFVEPFLQYVDSVLHNSKDKARLTDTIPIHVEKMGEIGDELVSRKLARKANYPWYEVENWVGYSFMSYLSTTLGKLSEINADPVTDETPSFYINQQIQPASHRLTSTDKARMVILDNILPKPEVFPSISQLLEFKANNRQQLTEFRNQIEAFCIELSQIQNQEVRSEKLARFIHDSQENTNQIAERMRSIWKSITFTSLIPIIGTTTNLLHNSSQSDSVAVITSIATISSMVYKAYEGICEIDKIRRKPLFYLTRVNSAFRRSMPKANI